APVGSPDVRVCRGGPRQRALRGTGTSWSLRGRRAKSSRAAGVRGAGRSRPIDPAGVAPDRGPPSWFAVAAAELGRWPSRGGRAQRRYPPARKEGHMSPQTVTLTMANGPLVGQEYEFRDCAVSLLGRGPECYLRLPADPLYKDISRHHCLLSIRLPEV